MYVDAENDRIKQGDILKDLKYIDAHDPDVEYNLDFCVVLTQDCDLEQEISAIKKFEDSNEPGFVLESGKKMPTNDKYLSTILVCPAYAADIVKAGRHMAPRGWTMLEFNRDLWRPVLNNDSARYHYLKENPKYGLPALVLDFKHFYTLPREYVYASKPTKLARLDDMFGQSVVHRFSYFVSRVALPEEQPAAQP